MKQRKARVEEYRSIFPRLWRKEGLHVGGNRFVQASRVSVWSPSMKRTVENNQPKSAPLVSLSG